jgi:hypothetical protein
MTKIKQQVFLIAKGNPTLLVWDCPINVRDQIVSDGLHVVDQIGFVSERSEGKMQLDMMGNELCVNSLLATAFTANRSDGNIYSSGLASPVKFSHQINSTYAVTLHMSYRQSGNIILFEGIGFIMLPDVDEEVELEQLSRLESQYDVAAFGAMFYRDVNIKPCIYVRETKSLKLESACGSGSIAYALYSGNTSIYQPSGGNLLVDILDRSESELTCTVSGEIKRIANESLEKSLEDKQ